MKYTIAAFLTLVFLIAGTTVRAQKQSTTTTLILVRHAEKDTLTKSKDPELTQKGKLRAQKLATMFPNAKPDEMYSTPYIRTRETLRPWATATGIEIKDYNPSKQEDFAEQLKQVKGKTIVVAGHSNTIPALANLLLNSDKYPQLDESVYNKIYVITIKKGKAKATVIEY